MTPRRIIGDVYSDLELNAVSVWDAVDSILARLDSAGYVILPAAEAQAMDEAVELLSDSLCEFAPISGENHRKRVVEFIAQHRSLRGAKP